MKYLHATGQLPLFLGAGRSLESGPVDALAQDRERMLRSEMKPPAHLFKYLRRDVAPVVSIHAQIIRAGAGERSTREGLHQQDVR